MWCALETASAPVAQWIAHQTSNLGVAGSSPAWGIIFFFLAVVVFYVAVVACSPADQEHELRLVRVPAFARRHGATVAREIPDLKVGGSNPSGVTRVVCVCVWGGGLLFFLQKNKQASKKEGKK